MTEILFVAAMIALVVWVLIPWFVRGQKKRLSGIGQLLFSPGNYEILPIRSSFFGLVTSMYLKGTKDGKDFAIGEQPPSKHSPAFTEVFYPAAVPFALSISKEDGLDRLAQKLRLTAKIKIGDRQLDELLFIKGDAENTVRSFAARGDFRELLHTLARTADFSSLAFISEENLKSRYKLSFRGLQIDRPGIFLVLSRPVSASPQEAAEVRVLAEKISRLL